ncbi:MAG: hypothetical protein K6E21_01675 [Bacilli bacterium]|nr:hypothetical protein [Bacilli bacterium]
MEKKHNILMLTGFGGYFLILFLERVYSIVSSLTKYGFAKVYLKGAFNIYSFGLTTFCLFLALVIFLRIIGKILANGIGANSKLMIIDAGVLLVAGMLDTPESQIIIQFIAYIFLFVACFTKFIEIMHKKEAVGSTIASFIYFIAFGMAIPLVHNVTNVDSYGRKIYLVFEALTSGGLVVTFTIMMLFLFSEERYKHVNNVVFLGLLLAGNALVFIQGMVLGVPNFFPVIAAGVAVVAYIVTVLLLFRDKRARIL